MRPGYSVRANFQPRLRNAHLAALMIEEAIAGELRPGRTGREVVDLSKREGAKLGYQYFLGGPIGSKAGFVDHGVRLEIDEYPVIGPLDHKILENMTIAIEPKMIFLVKPQNPSPLQASIEV